MTLVTKVLSHLPVQLQEECGRLESPAAVLYLNYREGDLALSKAPFLSPLVSLFFQRRTKDQDQQHTNWYRRKTPHFLGRRFCSATRRGFLIINKWTTSLSNLYPTVKANQDPDSLMEIEWAESGSEERKTLSSCPE